MQPTLEKISHSQLEPFLASFGLEAHIPHYITRILPQEKSLAALVDGQVVGAGVCGRSFDHYEVFEHWVVTKDDAAAAALLRALKQDPYAISISTAHKEISREVFGEKALSSDCLYSMEKAQFQPVDSTYQVRPFTGPQLQPLVKSPELEPFFSSRDFASENFIYYGIVEGEELASIGEMMVDDGRHVTLQQLFTVSSHRGKGMARAMVSEMVKLIFDQNKVPTYLVSADNAASRAVCEKLGFQLWGEFIHIS